MTHVQLFISSTFRDMDAERDLVLDVLRPRLQTALMQRQIAASVDVVDLRWGVNTQDVPEEERENKVLAECLDCIRASKPFFIGFLGHRYGWIPPRERWEAVVGSFTDDERAFMGDSINEVKSVTELEMLFGALYDRKCLPNSFFFLRGTEAYDAMDDEQRRVFVDADAEAMHKQELLRQKIRAAYEGTGYEGNIIPYDCQWNGERMLIDDRVLDRVVESIVHMIAARVLLDEAQVTELSLMNEQDQLFMAQSNACFAGREAYLDLLMKGIRTVQAPFIVTAPDGWGKTALIAQLYARLAADDHCLPLIHFAQLKGPMANVEGMLKKWLSVLPDPAQHRPLNMDSHPWLLYQLLISAAQHTEKQVVLLIDNAQYLQGLECLCAFQGLPECLSVVLTSDGRMTNLVDGENACYIPLQGMDAAEASALVDGYTRSHHKSLPDEAKRLLLAKQRADGVPASSLPLWTVLMLNHLINLDVDDFASMRHLDAASAADQITEYLMQEIRKAAAEPAMLAGQLVARFNRADGANVAAELLDMAAGGMESIDNLRSHLRQMRGEENLPYMDYMAARKVLNPLLYADDITGFTMVRYPRLFADEAPADRTVPVVDEKTFMDQIAAHAAWQWAAAQQCFQGGSDFVAELLQHEAALNLALFSADSQQQIIRFAQSLRPEELMDVTFSGVADADDGRLIACAVQSEKICAEKFTVWHGQHRWEQLLALQCSFYAWCSAVQSLDELHSRLGEKGCPEAFLEQQIAHLDEGYHALSLLRDRSMVAYAADALYFSVKSVQCKNRRSDMGLYMHYMAQQERFCRALHDLLPGLAEVKRRLACVLDETAFLLPGHQEASADSLRLFTELYDAGAAQLSDVLYAGANRMHGLSTMHRDEEALALADALLEKVVGREAEVQSPLAVIYDYQAHVCIALDDYEKALEHYGRAYGIFLESFRCNPADLVSLHDLCKNLKAQIDLCWIMGMRADSALNTLMQLTQYAVQTYPNDVESSILFMQARVVRLCYAALSDTMEGIVEEGRQVMALVEQLTRRGVRYTYFEKRYVLTTIRVLQANGHIDEADGVKTSYLHLRDELVGSRKAVPEWFEV